MSNSTQCLSFSKLAGNYLRSLSEYREAKAAVAVARKLDQPAWTIRDLEFHAARLQDAHQSAVVDLVSRAVEMREKGVA